MKTVKTYHYYFISDVAISTVASFNRMKQITDDINLVVKAMKMSSMLEVCCERLFTQLSNCLKASLYTTIICHSPDLFTSPNQCAKHNYVCLDLIYS